MVPRQSKGFTLIEMLAVIGIISILMALAYFSFRYAQRQSRDQLRRNNVDSLVAAVENYYLNNPEGYPEEEEFLAFDNSQDVTGMISYLGEPLTYAKSLEDIEHGYYVYERSDDKLSYCIGVNVEGDDTYYIEGNCDNTIRSSIKIELDEISGREQGQEEEVCVPQCDGKQCGSDSCGGSCGDCPANYICRKDSSCIPICVPNCAGKTCGSDGCGGTCGSCPKGYKCDWLGQCSSICIGTCYGRLCGDNGCGKSCGTCPKGYTCTEDGRCSKQVIERPPEPEPNTNGEFDFGGTELY